MSRVERFCISRNFPESGVQQYRGMVARLDRRGEGRARVVGEELLSNPSSKRGMLRERKPPDERVKIDVFHWPLGSGRKRY